MTKILTMVKYLKQGISEGVQLGEFSFDWLMPVFGMIHPAMVWLLPIG